MERLQATTRRVTSTDVAREVGLSRTTVSYVLNNKPNQTIPETTRQRVFEAAARMGYAPSAAARTLRSGRSDVVLIMLPDWPIGVVLGRLLESISGELGRHGLTLLTHPGTDRTNSVAHVLAAVSPDAVVSFEPFDTEERTTLRAAAVQVALVLNDRRGPNRVRSVDQRKVGRMQVEHLAAQGHRSLGYAFPDDPRVADFAEPRLAGVREGCAELGFDEPAVRTVGMDVATAARAVDEWRALGTRVTGVCAYNDEVAFAVLAGLRVRGLRAPADLAVIGVDDIPSAPLADPPLTTVQMDEDLTGRYIANAVVAALAGRAMPRSPGSAAIVLRQRESA